MDSLSVRMNENIRTLDELIRERYGERGTPKREKFERRSRIFKTEYLREIKTYRGKFVRIPGEVERYSPLSVKRMVNRISLLVRMPRGKTETR